MSEGCDRRQMLASAAAGFLLLPAGVAEAATLSVDVPARDAGTRARLSLDRAWRFHEGDVPMPVPLDHEASYSNAKAGNAVGAASTDYDDADWALVDLPHDFALGQPYDPTANLDEGYRRRGIGWYRRTFAIAEAYRDQHFELEIGAAATYAIVWFNGTLVQRHFTGFTGFRIDLTPLMLFGDDPNTLVIRVDAHASEGWWYEGAGLYRHVWLTRRDPLHIVTDGLHADPVRAADGTWRVPVEIELANWTGDAADVEVEVELSDPDARPAAAGRTAVAIAPSGRAVARLTLGVPHPRLWSPDEPTLYGIRAVVRRGATPLDAAAVSIGFRTIRFDPAKGFFLNDAPLKIRGVCAHQDHAGVGVAVPDSLWDYRVRRLKAMGANALRCAHNAPAAELLEACDRLGLLVMNENRNFNVSEENLAQLAWLVRRDRNHPSVILWSLCNEESLQSSPVGVAMIRRMKAVVRALDRSRPVTAAMNAGFFASVTIAQELDVVGFNYSADQYDRYHAAYPDRPLMSSEDTSAYMTRGAYRTSATAHVLAAYDKEHTDFGLSHRDAWRALAERRFMAGGFFWTGFDYRGEPSPFQWPTASSLFGAMDLCGFAKTAFHIRRALWAAEPVLEIAPHWTWPGREGEAIEVMAITNADQVVLSLNGRTVADLAVDRYQMATCRVPYAPGRLEAVGFSRGRPVAHRMVETAGTAASLMLSADRPWIDGDARDALPVTVSVVDAHGRPLPTADLETHFTVEGGRILGLGNGDPNSHESDLPSDDPRRHLFNGLAQVIVQAGTDARALRLVARAPGVRAAVLRVPVRPKALVPAVRPMDAVQMLTEWRQSPATAARPDPNEALAESDMNSWGWTKSGSTEPAPDEGRFTRFRVTFVPRTAVRRGGGTIRFGRLSGRAEIWLDGQRVAVKADAAPAPLSIALPPGDATRTLTILFDSPIPSPPFGIAASVTVIPAR